MRHKSFHARELKDLQRFPFIKGQAPRKRKGWRKKN